MQSIILKKKILKELESNIDLRKVKNDYHAKREPRDCGLTIHPGIGCDLGCVYCYIKDMGFPTDKVEPYPLSGEELMAALTLNKNVGVGPSGTYFAVGSVTEPFHPLLLDKTLEYLNALKRLGNYTQISYKMIVPDGKLPLLASSSEDRLSVLISISSLKKWKEFEPRLPSPELRLHMAEKLQKLGKRVSLFLRPILPGITDVEIDNILETALSYNVKELTVGGLRVTRRIMDELIKRGVKLEGRLRRRSKGREQVYVYTRDIKNKIIKKAESLGMTVYFTACDTNARHHGEVCWDSCKYDRNLCERLPPIDQRDLQEGIEMLGGKLVSWRIRKEPILELEIIGAKRNMGWLIQMAYRRQVIVRTGGRVWKYL
ncbi:DNA photolyase [Ignicoccus pacificus DSM 13166]|uniref:DNA photolyase n=1 Tax=Ignicoccus pacificus DSM 13166 TaxID=940294 RepID=A0A977PL27_9CREN|nr:DNA photolyase [Ignicoccus pacificus DSM 13166]